jgi:fucose 4-O-acetylase-like acetyltransferase
MAHLLEKHYSATEKQMNNKQVTLRNSTIDIAKGLGIILVVFGHNWVVLHEKGELFRVIFSFHVPLFFFLSGIFIKESSSLKHFVSSRFHSLLKPYFVILSLLGLVKVNFEFLKTGSIDSASGYFQGVLYGVGRTIDWVPLWFLPNLFIASFAALLFIKYVRVEWILWLCLPVILIIGVWVLGPADLPWSIDILPISLGFLLFGYLCKDFAQAMVFSWRLFLLALASFVALHYYFDETIDLNLRIYGDFAISTIQACLGIYLCVAIACILNSFEPIKRVGEF